MSLNATFSHYFTIVQTKQSSCGKCPIYLRITVDGQKVDYSTKARVNPKEWIGGKSLSSDKSINTLLKSIERKLLNTYNSLSTTEVRITAQLLKDELLGVKKRQFTLLGAMKYHNDRMEALVGKKFAYGTLKNYRTSLKYLSHFVQVNYKVRDIPLVELKYKFLEDFEFYLTTQKSCTNNGVMKQIERLRKVVNMAVSNEWIDKNPFSKFKMHFDKVDRGYLTMHELKSIESLELGNATLAKVRDYFMFSCYTGLSYADIKALKWEHLQKDDQGNYWIRQKREKSDVMAQIPLLKKPLQLIGSYRDLSPEHVFPVISNQKTNDYLKRIGTMAGITKVLHFHLARHTFATTITLSNNVPLETVSKMMGHTKISTTQIYARTLKEKIWADMNRVSEILNKE